jgi:hypothetical protein
MSKNTGTSELINYFDLGANGDVGIAGSLDVNTIANATTDTDRFLVSDTGIIKYRTGAELLTDIGAQGLLTNPVTGTGNSNYLSKFTAASAISNSQIFDNGTNVGVNTTGAINVDTGWTNFTVNGTSVGLIGLKSNGTNIGAMYGSSANNDFTIQAYGASNSARINFLTASSLRMSILGNGNVTVGTSNATTLRFTVAQLFSSHSMPALGSLGGLFGFFNTDTEGGDLRYGLVGDVNGSTGNVSLQAQRVDGTATAYNMILQQNGGNVLIGTTTDVSRKLNVNGAIRASYYSFLANVGGGEWQIGSDSTAGTGMYFYQTTSGYSLILSAAGLGTFGSGIITNGNIELTNGVNRSIIIGSASNYNYRLRTDGDDFVINEAGITDRLRYSYTNVRWTITGGLTVSGSLSKGSGSFKIDHPLPEKKDTHQLVHSFIEGPRADNIYRGKVKLVDGYAEVNIDEVSKMTEGTFVLLNGNVQCFTSNESGWTAIKGRIDSNILIIESEDSECTDTVSWLVVGERHDQHMIDTDWTDENGKVIVEPLKK